MSYGKRRTKEGTASAQVSTSGIAARLLWLNFYAVTNGDNLEIRNGGATGTVIFTLVVGAYGNAYVGPFPEKDAPVFGADLYVKCNGTGTYQWNATYMELE